MEDHKKMKKEIFVLEDDDGIRELIEFLLQDQGYGVTTFPRIMEFTEYLETKLPDLVVLDIWLPDGDGRTVCRSLKGDPSTEEIPILMMTASSVINGVLGADDFIPKPFEISDFLTKIDRLLSSSSS